jgi:hypothetical protein
MTHAAMIFFLSMFQELGILVIRFIKVEED